MRLDDPIAHYRIDAEEFDYFSDGSGPDRDSAQRIRDGVLSHAKIAPAHRVLDAGSGNGWLYATRTHREDGLTVCIDLGLRNLQVIRQRYGDRPALVVCDIARLPFREGVFDRAVASEVLEHVNDPGEAVAQLAHTLRHSAVLVVSTPYREKLHTYLCVHCNRVTTVNAHLHSFDESVLAGFMSAAGLSRVRQDLLQNRLFIASRLSWALRFLPFRIWKIIDRFFTFVYHKPGTIITAARKD